MGDEPTHLDDIRTGDGRPWSRERAEELIATLNEVEMEFGPSEHGWRYGGGRDLDRLIEKARESTSDSLAP
ncbi:hypothetical protein GCM10029976_020870 [Kribbella albertanoniae]|uniref:Uncharacterized protein n=1 Tax=Kribbella albertanoniae TaxID=1266829 RepID=A0A4R4QAH0_9ACTN|nr:hypothetical protein [Kribbella albertanoniae]TDC32386.1 hypothetical protein E1261_08525 [Kribbella albertanoniae]